MTREDFIQRRDAFIHVSRRVDIAATIVFTGLLISLFFLDHHLNALRSSAILFAAFCSHYFFARWWKQQARRRGLACPACAKLLTMTAGQITVATGRCGHCGAKVFDS